jgi:hypothetical protein
VSTPIRDVVRPYGDLGLVAIANGAGEFIKAVDSLLHGPPDMTFRARVDQFLSQSSWDKTWGGMSKLIHNTLVLKGCAASAPLRTARPARPVMAAGDISHEGAAHV